MQQRFFFQIYEDLQKNKSEIHKISHHFELIGDKINVDLSLGTKSLYLFVLKGIFKFESWNNIHSLEFLKK